MDGGMRSFGGEFGTEIIGYCMRCGAPLEDGSMFCTSCGSRAPQELIDECEKRAEERKRIEEEKAARAKRIEEEIAAEEARREAEAKRLEEEKAAAEAEAKRLEEEKAAEEADLLAEAKRAAALFVEESVQPVSEVPKMENPFKYCTGCGKKLDLEDIFCSQCGTKQK